MASTPNNPHNPPEETSLKILIVRIGAMGDVLHALPAVAALRERLPGCVIGWAIEPRWRALLTATDEQSGPIVDRIHHVPTRDWKRKPLSLATVRQIMALRRELVPAEYDVCMDLQGSIKSAVVGRLAQARRLVGPRCPTESPAKVFYSERIETKAAHVIDQACELLRAALPDGDDDLRPARVELPIDMAAEIWADQRLAELAISAAGFVLLVPTAGWGAKQWPVERYRELAVRLHAAGLRVLVNGGSAADLAVAQSIGTPAITVQCGIPELIALTRRARLVIGGDTGPVHLAAALGCPVVALFGPTDPGRNGPCFPRAKARALRDPNSGLDHTRRVQTEAGLARISEDEVIAAAFELLKDFAHG